MADPDIVEIMARGVMQHTFAGPATVRTLVGHGIAALVASGHRIVPAEPTQEMIDAGEASLALGADYFWENTERLSAECYAAMISAGNLAGRK